MLMEVFTDGSANGIYAAYSFVIVVEGKVVFEESGLVTSNVKKTNVAGELAASMRGITAAVKYAVSKHEVPEITVRHDYEGVGKWVSGEWKAKEEHTQAYRDWTRRQTEKVSIAFKHVYDGSHPMNVRAHELAYSEFQKAANN